MPSNLTAGIPFYHECMPKPAPLAVKRRIIAGVAGLRTFLQNLLLQSAVCFPYPSLYHCYKHRWWVDIEAQNVSRTYAPKSPYVPPWGSDPLRLCPKFSLGPTSGWTEICSSKALTVSFDICGCAVVPRWWYPRNSSILCVSSVGHWLERVLHRYKSNKRTG